MSVSNRFREIFRDVDEFRASLTEQGETAPKGARDVMRARAELAEWVEQVGEIPRMSLEYKLTPVLLKVHNNLDRARLSLVEDGLDEQANLVWALQQKIYRLLNDL